MYSNLFVSLDNPLQKVALPCYLIDQSILPENFYKITKGFEWFLFNRGVFPITMGNKVIYMGKDNLEDSYHYGGYDFKKSNTKIELNSLDHQKILAKIISQALKRQAFRMGYMGPESQKYVRRDPYKSDILDYYEAFFSEIEVYSNGKIGVWLDPSTRWKFPLKYFFKWAKKNNIDDPEHFLIGKRVKCPKVSKEGTFNGRIKEIVYQTIDTYKFKKGSDVFSIYNYWTQEKQNKNWCARNKIKLYPNDMPVILVKTDFSPEPLCYPYNVLEIVIDPSEHLLPNKVFNEKKILNPKNRIEETLKIYDMLLSSGLDLGQIKIRFIRDLHSWKNNKDIPYNSIIQFNPPELRFGGDNVCKVDSSWQSLPIKSSLENFGPISKVATIPIIYIIPSYLQSEVRKYNNNLNHHAKRLNLGNFEIKNIIAIKELTPDRYMRTCLECGNNLSNGIVNVIIPNKNTTRIYRASKRALGKNAIKSQMIRESTLKKILNSSEVKAEGYIIALKNYGRYLRVNQSIWHLNKPAGNLSQDKTVYFMGFDVSRNPETRAEAAAYAAICDSLGQVLYKNSIESHRGERVESTVLNDWFVDVAMSTYLNTNKKLIDYLMLFKDGPIYSNQVEEYKKGALNARERLIKEGIMNENSDIKVIAVIKRGVHRIYGSEQRDYKIKPLGLIRNDKEALLITSRPYRGTATSQRLVLTHQGINNMNIIEISQLFNDLRYLDWNSLFNQPKTILPLHIVQNLAILNKEDINVPYIPR